MRGRRVGSAAARRLTLVALLLPGAILLPAEAGAQSGGSPDHYAPAPTPAPLTPAPGGPAGTPVPDPQAGRATVLSDERRRSTWAYVEVPTTARAGPRASARAVKRLRTYTSDGTPELVLALALGREADGSEWVKVRLPMRPNNRTGWVRRDALGTFRLVTTAFVIDRRRLRARLYRDGRRVWQARIGIGKRGAPTPAGRFYVRERLVPARRDTIYGVFAFGLSAYSPTLTDWPGGGVIGVHGTNRPEILPGRVSHGCVRVPNPRISKLRRLMSLGTPILIK